MEEHTENKDWLKEAPMLAKMPVQNPFSVPEGYFENLKDKTSSKFYLENLKIELPETGFTTPEDYFSKLKDSINAEIIADDMKSVVLNDGYIAPAGYFEQMQAQILAKTVVEKEPKIIRLWHSKILKYTSAACFIIIASLGLYFNQHHPITNSPTNLADLATDQMLYDIDEQVIIDHIQNDNTGPGTTAENAALESYILSNYSQNELAGNL